jgi:hypothetical protein
MMEKINNDVINRNQKSKFNCPFAELEMTAKMIKTAVSVKIVPPNDLKTLKLLINWQ